MDAIRTRRLTKRFGDTVALDDLTLSVPRGSVFGYLGPNGAGKTTTIRLLAGLLRPSSGHAAVLGADVTDRRDAVHARTGYLPGEFSAYPDLTGEQYLRYLANLRGDVHEHAWRTLADRFGLDTTRRIGAMSHGNRQKVGIVQAFMHSPQVLILDEPTIGLDPLMQREFLDLVAEVRDEGRTVFLSSHILDEVEAIADTVAILRDGRLVAVESVDALKRRAVRRLDITFDGPRPHLRDFLRLPAVRDVSASGRTVHLELAGDMVEVFRLASPYDIANVTAREADLESIFLSYYEEAPPAEGDAFDDLELQEATGAA